MLNFNQSTDYDTYTYDQLNEKCQSCQKCGLSQQRTNVVFGSGPVPCNIMIIGEGPGAQEDEQGLPFVGKAGQLLSKILTSAQLNRDTDTYITNTVKCRPPNNRTPLPSEIDTCLPYLIHQIQLIQPKLLLLLGSPALKTILGNELSISKARGNWFQGTVQYMDEPLYIMPLFHPSYLLRNQSKSPGSPKWLTWNDIKEIKAALSFYKTT